MPNWKEALVLRQQMRHVYATGFAITAHIGDVPEGKTRDGQMKRYKMGTEKWVDSDGLKLNPELLTFLTAHKKPS